MEHSFGSNLSILRKRAGISQEALADHLNISRQAVSSWERDLSEPDVGTIRRIAGLLNVPVSHLIERPADGGADEPPRLKPALTVLCIALAAVHFVLGLCRYVNLFAVLVLPVMCAFIQSTIYAAFAMMRKSGNYDLLAGFDPKKDSVQATQLQMYWVSLLSGLTAALFELLFTAVYFTAAENQMRCTTILLFSYYAAIILCILAVHVKIKTRKS